MATQDTAMVQVPFYGDVLEATEDSGKVLIHLRRACDNLGLSMEGQLKKLKSKPWATVNEMFTVAEDGKRRSVTMIDLDTLPGWLFSIDARKVKEHVREKLARYQKEAARVLAEHFFGRKPTAPGLTAEDVAAIVRRIIAEAQPLGLIPAVPRFSVRERCRFKGWHTTSYKQRDQIRRLANWLLELRHGETPDVTGQVCTYYGHQVAVLDEAIDRVREEYARRDLRRSLQQPGLFADLP
jgi:hypothetical protein